MLIYLIIASILMLIGFVGVIIPILPGIPVMFLIALIFGFVTRFQTLNSIELIILALTAIVSLIVDYSTGLIGAKYGGATKKSILAGFAGLLVGTIVFPPFGGIIGLFIAVLLYELLTHSNKEKALKAASGSLIGSLAGILINFILGVIFIISFISFALN